MAKLEKLREIGGTDSRIIIPRGINPQIGILRDPELTINAFVENKKARVIHNTDRSTVYELLENPISGEQERFLVKKVHARFKELTMRGEKREVATQLLERRVNNEINSARNAMKRGINSNADLFNGAVIQRDVAWMLYDHLGEGVFLFELLKSRDTLKDRFSLDLILGELAGEFLKLHGKNGQGGYLHGDLNLGNIFLGYDGQRPKLIDWEMCDESLGAKKIPYAERIRDLFKLRATDRNAHYGVRLEEGDFRKLKKAYLYRLNGKRKN
jgi:serine/threonine protein kinase